MKGIILAGGKGTRLYPLTTVTNKHLVPVGKLPMIEYPLHTLKNLNVDSISVVTVGENFQDIAQYLGTLHSEDNFSFHYQSKAGGIAQALALTESFVKYGKIAVILGDNIFEEDFSKAAEIFEKSDSGAMIFLKEVNNSSEYGVAEIIGGKVEGIEEKPKIPRSNLAVTGLYFYDSTVFDKIKLLKPSMRGELEITDVNNMYQKEGRLSYYKLSGFWGDAGTFESRDLCNNFVKEKLEAEIGSKLSLI